MLVTTTRNATLTDLVALLRDQHARKLDIVTPADAIRARDGLIVVSGAAPVIDADGVTPADGSYLPTAVFDEGTAEKLGIPLGYLRKLREERLDLYDLNVNGWLHGRGGPPRTARPGRSGTDRSFLLRLFRGDTGIDGQGVGVARAMLSTRFARIEHLDVLMAALDGVRRAGVRADIVGADLSDRRMYVRIAAPEVQALAPTLLRNYRSPFTGAAGADNPVVFAGFEISNCEVGGGAFTITPRLVIQVCSNGLQVTRDALRAIHLGGRLDDGIVHWTDDTQRRAAELVAAKTRDAVTTFLDTAYMQRVISGVEGTAGTPVAAPAETIQTLGRRLAYDDASTQGILDHFIRGGDVTAGGVLQAVTSYAQTVADADLANALESTALRAMELAAAA